MGVGCNVLILGGPSAAAANAPQSITPIPSTSGIPKVSRSTSRLQPGQSRLPQSSYSRSRITGIPARTAQATSTPQYKSHFSTF